MPVYGTPQSGGLTSVSPGSQFVMWDGTETPALNVKSIAFSRASIAGLADNGSSFDAQGMPASSAISIQGSNTDSELTYITLNILNPDSNSNAYYTDIGRFMFYRAQLTTYTSGTMPILIVQR